MPTVFGVFLFCLSIAFLNGDEFGADVVWETQSLYEGVATKLHHQYRWSASEANDVEIYTNLTLANFFYGKLLTIDRQTLADMCPLANCPVCQGRKIVTVVKQMHPETETSVHYPCPACAGFGKVSDSLPCFELGLAAINSNKDSIQLLIPPGSYPGQVLEYKPFASKLLSIVSTAHEYLHPSDFGKLKIVVQNVSLQAHEANLKFESGDIALPLVLQLPLSSSEALFGFRKEVQLFEHCAPLVISRNKPVLPNANVSLPITDIYQKLCNVSSDDYNDLLRPVNTKNDEAEGDNMRYQFRVDFAIRTESEEKLRFLQYWNCSYSNIANSASPQDEENDFPPADVSNSSETVFCQNHLFPEERAAAFRSFRVEQVTRQKYRSYLEFLSKL